MSWFSCVSFRPGEMGRSEFTGREGSCGIMLMLVSVVLGVIVVICTVDVVEGVRVAMLVGIVERVV